MDDHGKPKADLLRALKGLDVLACSTGSAMKGSRLLSILWARYRDFKRMGWDRKAAYVRRQIVLHKELMK